MYFMFFVARGTKLAAHTPPFWSSRVWMKRPFSGEVLLQQRLSQRHQVWLDCGDELLHLQLFDLSRKTSHVG
jgi:hypothetical protein